MNWQIHVPRGPYRNSIIKRDHRASSGCRMNVEEMSECLFKQEIIMIRKGTSRMSPTILDLAPITPRIFFRNPTYLLYLVGISIGINHKHMNSRVHQYIGSVFWENYMRKTISDTTDKAINTSI